MSIAQQNQPLQMQGEEKVAQTSDFHHDELRQKYKSRSLKVTSLQFQSSFSQNVQQAHIEAIWKSSIKLLQDSLLQAFDQELGMNSSLLFNDLDFSNSFCNSDEDLTIQKILSCCSGLTYQEKNQLVIDFKNQRDLSNLIEGLYHKFHINIFSQILTVIKIGWEKYLEFKKNNELPKELEKFFGPRLLDLSEENIENVPKKTIYIQSTAQNLVKTADQIGDSIAYGLYISSSYNYINLKETDAQKKQDRQVSEFFKEFIKSIIRGVFLCTEGCFIGSNANEGILGLLCASSRDSLDDQMPSFGEIRKMYSWN